MEIKDINIGLCMEALHPSKAMLALGTPLTAIPLDNVEEVAVEWGPFTTAENFPMYKEFLRWFTWPTNALNAKQPKSYVDGKAPNQPSFEIPGQKFYGRWRMAGVRERRQQTAPNTFQYYIGVTLRFGFLQAFEWAEVRMAEGWTSPGNDSVITTPVADGAAPISDTTSDDPEQVLMLRLANVDPTKMFTIAKTINALVTGTLTVEGVGHGTDWHFVVAHPMRQQDGSGTIEFMVAKPQFTINAFQDNNTSREVSVGYLWQVPKALAQTIITAWDYGAGRSASASYGKDARFVDIVLTAVVGRANLTTPWRQRNCNEWVRYHFAWGYTEAQVYTDATPGPESGFLFDHSSAIGSTEDGKIIRSRTDSTNIRGDGLFDVVIIETSFDNVAAGDVYTEYPDFSITLWTGTKITRRVDHGYKIGLANLELLKAVYDASGIPDVPDGVTGEINPAVGKSVDFRVTRQDDCSFDYIATIDTATKVDSGLVSRPVLVASPTVGIANDIQAVTHATAAELVAIIQGVNFGPGIGRRLSIQATINDDETIAAVIEQVKAQTSVESDETVDLGALGTAMRVTTGHNVTEAELTAAIAVFTSGARKSLDIDVSGGDDGGFDYKITERTVQAVEGSKPVGDSTLYYGLNVDAITPDLSAVVNRSSSISANNDGTVNYAILTVPLYASTQDKADAAGVLKNKRYEQTGWNQASIPATTGARLLSYTWNYNDNGKINYAIISRDLEAVTVTGIDDGLGAGGIKAENTAGINVAQASVPVPSASRLVDDEVDVQATEDGLANYRRGKRTMQETEISVVHGIKGEKVTEEIHRNAADDDAAITGLTALAFDALTNGQRVVLEAVIDDKKNVTFRKATHQKVQDEQRVIGGTYFEKETIDLSVNDVTRDAADLQQWTEVEEGKSILFQARLDPDGSIDWDRRTREKQARDTLGVTLIIARLAPALDRYGYYDTGRWFHGVKLADMGSVDLDIAPAPGADEYGYIEEIRRDPVDGTFSGKKVVRVYAGASLVTASPAVPDQITGATPSAAAKTSYTLKWVVWAEGLEGYWIMTGVFQEYWTEDYSQACEFLDTAGAETDGFVTVPAQGPDYRVVSGVGYWFARKMTSLAKSAYTTLASGTITP